MSCAFTKAKLPRGTSFPLSRSVLDASLAGQAVVGDLHHVYYATSQVPGLLLRALFTGENRRGWFAAGKSALWIFSVPSRSRALAEGLLLGDGLPQVVGWLNTLRSAGNAVRGPDHSLELHIQGDGLRIATDAS